MDTVGKYEGAIKKCIQNQLQEYNPSSNVEMRDVQSYPDKEQAIEALKPYKSKIEKIGSGFLVTEFYIEENEYNEEGDPITSFGVWEFSGMEIQLINRETHDTIDTFDNYNDAEEAYNNYDGNDAYISY